MIFKQDKLIKIKLIDLGIAKKLSNDNQKLLFTSSIGTAYYMAPELIDLNMQQKIGF